MDDDATRTGTDQPGQDGIPSRGAVQHDGGHSLADGMARRRWARIIDQLEAAERAARRIREEIDHLDVDTSGPYESTVWNEVADACDVLRWAHARWLPLD